MSESTLSQRGFWVLGVVMGEVCIPEIPGPQRQDVCIGPLALLADGG